MLFKKNQHISKLLLFFYRMVSPSVSIFLKQFEKKKKKKQIF